MLIATSCAFLIFNVPLDIFFLGYGYGTFSDATADDLTVKMRFYTAATILSYTNNSINFFTYAFIVIITSINHRRHQRYQYCFYVLFRIIFTFKRFYYYFFTINFFMYFVSGRKFRVAFVSTFSACCRRCGSRDAVTTSSGQVQTGHTTLSSSELNLRSLQ